MDILERIALVPLFVDRDISPPTWVIDSFIAKHHYHLFTGAPGKFKSTIALWIAKCFLKYGRVIFVDLENSDQIVAERMKWLKIDTTDKNLIYWNESTSIPIEARPITTLDPSYEQLADPNTLFVFDTIIRLHNKDENAATEMKQIERFCRRLTRKGATVLALHHSGKSHEHRDNSVRGSSELMAGADVVATVRYLNDHSTIPRVTIECTKSRLSRNWKRDYYLDRQKGEFVVDIDYEPALIKNFVMENNGVSTEALIRLINEEFRFPQQKIRTLLSNLPRKRDGKSWIYLL